MIDATKELKEFYNYVWGEESPTNKPTFVYLPIETNPNGLPTCLNGLGNEKGSSDTR